MEVVKHDDEGNNEIKSAADIAAEGHNVHGSEKKPVENIDPQVAMLNEALANSQKALNAAQIALQTSGTFSMYATAVQQLLISKKIITVEEMTQLVNQIKQQHEEVAKAQVNHIANDQKGLSPEDNEKDVEKR